jgi:hypothetical protein
VKEKETRTRVPKKEETIVADGAAPRPKRPTGAFRAPIAPVTHQTSPVRPVAR